MSAIKWFTSLFTVEDFLAFESLSPIKHEYLGGLIYPLKEECALHRTVCANSFAAMQRRLQGRPWCVVNSDTKLRLRSPTRVSFYYPDVAVVRRADSLSQLFQDNPAVLIEVLSKRTRRTDEVEKKDAYLNIPSLSVYLLVEQEFPAVVAFRRTETGFVREVYEGLDAVIPLGEIEIELPLREIYEAVTFVAEADEDEEVLGR